MSETVDEIGLTGQFASATRFVGKIAPFLTKEGSFAASAAPWLRGIATPVMIGIGALKLGSDIKHKDYKDATETVVATASALAGAQAGAVFGTMICPGLGTAIGAGIGGGLGYLAGREAGDSIHGVLSRQFNSSASPQVAAAAPVKMAPAPAIAGTAPAPNA